MTAVASPSPPVNGVNRTPRVFENRKETIEERCFSAALICLEAHCAAMPSMGALTMAKVTSMISKTLEKTHNFKEVR